jgi:carbonic anhydrase/acetyltransferase-like protein (isoleucine patch superfamily)
MNETYRARLRSFLKNCRGFVYGKRPLGLVHLGSESLVEWPRKLVNRRSIRIGDRCLIRSHALLSGIAEYCGKQYWPKIEIGDDVYIGRHVYITACNKITISKGCVLSEHVYISDLTHGFDPQKGPIMRQELESKGGVLVGPNCFLGYRVTIMQGVELGEWCIVGAHSVVTRSFPAYSMIAGAPARLLKVYSHELRQWVETTRLEER